MLDMDNCQNSLAVHTIKHLACHCYGWGHCCIMSSIPGQGTSELFGYRGKKKKKERASEREKMDSYLSILLPLTPSPTLKDSVRQWLSQENILLKAYTY